MHIFFNASVCSLDFILNESFNVLSLGRKLKMSEYSII